MREIKFRAWDKETKKMHNALMLQSWLLMERNNGIAEGIVGIKQIPCDGANEFWPHLIFLEYTTLNDKRNDDDGTEIYDQDIASYDYDSASDPHGLHYPTDRGTVKGIVSWLEGGWVILDLNKDYVVDLWSGVYNCGVKVIGNIYEPPELLEGVK